MAIDDFYLCFESMSKLGFTYLILWLVLPVFVHAQIEKMEWAQKAWLKSQEVDELYFNAKQLESRKSDTWQYHGFVSHRGKPKLLLVHGFSASALMQYSNIMPALKRRFDVIALDLRFHGETQSDSVDFSVETQAEHVMEFMEALTMHYRDSSFLSFHILGHSYGGIVSGILAERYPNRVQSLTLYDSPIIDFSSAKTDSLARVLGVKDGNDLLCPMTVHDLHARYKALLTHSFWAPRKMSKKFIEIYVIPYRRHQLRLIQYLRENEIRLSQHVYQWSMPVKVIWGSNDRLVPLEVAYAIQKRYKTGIKVFRGCGHSANIENPNLFIRWIKRDLLSPIPKKF